jgi:hypothetical protein
MAKRLKIASSIPSSNRRIGVSIIRCGYPGNKTGMNVQKQRMRQIRERLREMKVFTLVGGTYASFDEGYFDDLCNVLFSGEAGETWRPDLSAASRKEETTEPSANNHIPGDMAKVPKPRFDLLKVNLEFFGPAQGVSTMSD